MKKIISLIIFSAGFWAAASGSVLAYDIYVNKNSSSAAEDGTEAKPFKTISGALSKISTENLKGKTIYVKDGEYKEHNLKIKKDTNIVGESKKGTIIDADDNDYGLIFSTKTTSKVKNITIKNADVVIKVEKRNKVELENVVIKDAKKSGIKIDKSSRKSRYQFSLIDSEVKDNGEQGLLIRKNRRIKISNCKIKDNSGSGIQMEEDIYARIDNCDIENNRENGIDAAVTNANFKFSKNNIDDNSENGITLVFFTSKDKPKIEITDNDIKNNDKYGIRYFKKPSFFGRDFDLFVELNVKLKGNDISGNGSGKYSYK